MSLSVFHILPCVQMSIVSLPDKTIVIASIERILQNLFNLKHHRQVLNAGLWNKGEPELRKPDRICY